MTKNYAKFVPPKPRTSSRRNWPISVFFAIFLGVAAVITTGCLYISRVQGGAVSQEVGALFSKVTDLIHTKKPSLATVKTAKTLSVASAAKDEQASVHFDFYDELPSMQVSPDGAQSLASPSAAPNTTILAPSAPGASASAVTPVVTENIVSPSAQASAQSLAQSKPAPRQVAEKKLLSAAVPPIFNPEEISNLLAAEQGQQHTGQQNQRRYIIEIGVFESRNAAERLRDAIAAVGFDVAVVKVKQGGHTFYHVQQGPYENATLAKESQSRLEKRGITSTVQKIPT